MAALEHMAAYVLAHAAFAGAGRLKPLNGADQYASVVCHTK